MKSLLIAISTAALFGNLPAKASAVEITGFVQIYEAQRVLYERGWGDAKNFPDGKMGKMTREMIREAESGSDRPITGELSQENYDALMELGVPSNKAWRWGAIAASTDGAHSSNWNYATREEAARSALSGCYAKSGSPEDCTMVTALDKGAESEGWIAAVFCESADYTYISLIADSTDATRDEVVSAAYAQAARKGYARDLCKLRTVIAADGSHK